jgi:hypothetical protein
MRSFAGARGDQLLVSGRTPPFRPGRTGCFTLHLHFNYLDRALIQRQNVFIRSERGKVNQGSPFNEHDRWCCSCFSGLFSCKVMGAAATTNKVCYSLHFSRIFFFSSPSSNALLSHSLSEQYRPSLVTLTSPQTPQHPHLLHLLPLTPFLPSLTPPQLAFIFSFHSRLMLHKL